MEVLRKAIGNGLPTLALGGGALLMLQRLADSRGRSHDLLGLVPCEAELIEWYDRPRLRERRGRPGTISTTRASRPAVELFDLEYLVFEQEAFAYQVRVPDGESGQTEGFAFKPLPRHDALPSSLRAGARPRLVAAMRRRDARFVRD